MGNAASTVELTQQAFSIGDKQVTIFALPELESVKDVGPTLRTQYDEEGGTVGLKVWPGSLSLADFLVNKRPDLVLGKDVIELGCGVGLVGLCVAKYCSPSSVVLTDRESLRPVVQANLESQLPVKFEALDWGNPRDLTKFQESASVQRVVIGSELVYVEEQEPLCNAIDAVVTDIFVLCYTERSDGDSQYFQEKVLSKRFDLVDKSGSIYILRRKRF